MILRMPLEFYGEGAKSDIHPGVMDRGTDCWM